MYTHAKRLIAELPASRRRLKATQRAIISIAHSLGVLFVKHVLIYASVMTCSRKAGRRSSLGLLQSMHSPVLMKKIDKLAKP